MKNTKIENSIYETINKSIAGEGWTTADLKKGKTINILESWKIYLHKIVSEYRKNGWRVYWFLDGKKEYLLFEHPAYKQK